MVNGILFDFIVKIHSFNSRKREDRYCFGKNSSLKIEFLQIFGLWDQKSDLWFTNHEPLIPTLLYIKMLKDSSAMYYKKNTKKRLIKGIKIAPKREKTKRTKNKRTWRRKVGWIQKEI